MLELPACASSLSERTSRMIGNVAFRYSNQSIDMLPLFFKTLANLFDLLAVAVNLLIMRPRHLNQSKNRLLHRGGILLKFIHLLAEPRLLLLDLQ